ncbi:TraB/GumN family protein [Vibrio rumoiensis]|uniref:Polysaccharide biosynthesis protein GumN n=1 Tax=Vibrio rumoiensis 1S-45 TaxID=1188252 RepID=A0A1E5E0Z3_9VIBR|nr:TraB/GumN family protein [Vibrio rumoiensis]OEF24230.1 hypothetical protein A1QC_10435 [Vibrio rumoiensis 1S-45]
MKNWLFNIVSLLTLSTTVFSTALYAEPMVWKATKGEQQLMLIGTIHIGQKSMYPLPSQLEQFMKQSYGLILEADVKANPPKIDFSESTLTTDVLNAEQRKKLEEIATELKLDKTVLLHLPPWLASLSIENQKFQSLGYDSNLGVDMILSDQAEALKLPLLTFETLQQQLDMLQNSPEDGKSLLLDSLGNWHEDKKFYQCMIQNWQDGDKNGLLKLLSLAEWDKETMQSLLYNRNQTWSDKIQDPSFLSPNGRYVIAVGTLHLIGENSLIEHLEKQGYRVKLVTKSTTSNCLN